MKTPQKAKAGARTAAAPAQGICPLCERAYPRARLQAHIARETPKVRRKILMAIRHDLPSWRAQDGACERCWEARRGVVRVVSFLEKFKQSRKPRLAARSKALLGLALLAGALTVSGCGKPAARQPQKLAVQTERAESMDHYSPGAEASYIAIVRAENETDLSFKIGGIVDLIGPPTGGDWDEGTRVKAGAVLARLKQPDFLNALSTAEAHAELTTKVRDRFRKLREKDAISQQEMDVTEANWLTAQAQLDQAKQNLSDSQLRAAIDGVVLARYVNSGVTVGAGQRVLRFADTSRMSVELGVPDRLVGYFSPGKEFTVEISTLEGRPPFVGQVSEVGVAASQEGRLFRIVIKVPNPKGEIRSGMTAAVKVGNLVRFSAGSVRVPLSALVTVPAAGQAAVSETPQLAVFVATGGKAARRPVKTGDILGSSIVVSEGLQAGEEVVTAGASMLYDGAPVEVLAKTPAGN